MLKITSFFRTISLKKAGMKLLGGVIAAGLSLSAWAQTADVYILAGQSNMMGTNNSESDLPAYLRSQQNDLFISGLLLDNSPSWMKMDAPNTGKYGNSLEFRCHGPEITFARKISDTTGRPTYVLKWALGGQNLHNDFLGKGGKGSDALYPYLTREKEKLEKRLNEQYGLTANYRAFVWMQGESDATSDLAPKYKQNLTDLVSRVRQDFKSNLPVVVGRLSNWQNGGDWGKVRQAQVDWANGDSNGYWINTDDLQRFANDGVHYTSKGLQDMGFRFAQKIIDNVLNEGPGTPVTTPTISGVKRLKDGWKGRFLHASGNYDWAPIQSAPSNTSWSSQKWKFEKIGNSNKYRIRNEWTKTYLSAGSQSDWDQLYVAPLNTSWTSQQWRLEKDGNRYLIQNVWSGKYLHTQGGDWSDILQTTKRTWSSQRYQLVNP